MHLNTPGLESITWRSKRQHYFGTKSQAHAEIKKPKGNWIFLIKVGTFNNAWSQHLDLGKRWLVALFYAEWSTKNTVASVSCRKTFLTTCLVSTILPCFSPNHIPFSLAPCCQIPIFWVMEKIGTRSWEIFPRFAEKSRGFPLHNQMRPHLGKISKIHVPAIYIY